VQLDVVSAREKLIEVGSSFDEDFKRAEEVFARHGIRMVVGGENVVKEVARHIEKKSANPLGQKSAPID